MSDEDKYILSRRIASILDHPSVYMGGPSPGNIRKGIKIVEHMLDLYDLRIKDLKHAEADREIVKSWRKLPWTDPRNRED